MKSSTALLSQITGVLDTALAKALPFADLRAYGLVEPIESGKGGLAMASRDGNFSGFDDGKQCTYYHRVDKVDIRQRGKDEGFGDTYNALEVVSARLGIYYARKNNHLDNYEISRLATNAIDGLFSDPERYGLLQIAIVVRSVALDSVQAMQDEFRSLGSHESSVERGFIVLKYDIIIKYRQNCAPQACE